MDLYAFFEELCFDDFSNAHFVKLIVINFSPETCVITSRVLAIGSSLNNKVMSHISEHDQGDHLQFVKLRLQAQMDPSQ